MTKQTRFPTCKQPDRDAPGMTCGYPLPCPWHTAVIDLTTVPATVNIPVTAEAALANQERLKKIGRTLGE